MKSRIAFLNRRWAIAILALALVAGPVGCKKEVLTSPSPVTIAQFGDLLLYIPLYLAADEGLFAKQGLDVRIISTGGDDKTYAAVISGSAQFGLADPTFVAIAREKGQTGTVVALIINGMPNYGVALSKDKPAIREPRELQGRTVASVPAPSTSYALLKKLYESAGLQPAIRQVSAPALVPTLQAGEADYAVLIEPWVSGVVASGGHVAFSLMDYYREFALTGLTCSSETLRKDPETIGKIVTALTESVKLFYNDEARTLRVAQKHFANENQENLKAGLARMRADKIFPRSLIVTENAWQAAIQLRKDTGDLAGTPLPMADYVENRFAAQAASASAQP